MALSKPAHRLVPEALSVDHGGSGLDLCCMWDMGQRFAVRMAAPWVELGEDMTEGITFYVRSAVDAIEAVGSTASPTTLAVAQKIQKLSVVQALAELSEDCHGVWFPAMVVALCPPTAGPLILAGVSFSLKCTYLAAAGMYGIWFFKYSSRQEGLGPFERNMMSRTMAVMFFGACTHLCLASGGLPTLMVWTGVPTGLVKLLVSPEVFLYALTNIVVHPLVFANFGYLSGARPSQMVPYITLNVLGSCCMMVSATSALPFQYSLLCTGMASAFGTGSAALLSNLEEQAHKISHVNERRAQSTLSCSACFWSLLPLIQAGDLLHIASPNIIRSLLALTDVFSKLGIMHLMLRSEQALGASANYFSSNAVDDNDGDDG